MIAQNKWLFFSTDADHDSLQTSGVVAYPAKSLKGISPAQTSGDDALTLTFESMLPMSESVTTVCDAIDLNLTTSNTHLDVMTSIIQAINGTRPTQGGFIVVADDTTTFVDNSTKQAQYLTSGISSCGSITLHQSYASNGFIKTIVATTDGTGTGTIPAVAGWYQVSSDGDDKIVILPDVNAGSEIWLDFSDTTHDFELRSHNPASVKINGGSGSNAETEIAKANVLVKCVRTISGWIVNSFAADGTETAEAAAA
jgi:hypothetical protein